MTHVEMLILALILDALLGEPKFLWSRVPHPAELMGKAIDRLDLMLNRGRLRVIKGGLAIGALALIAVGLGLFIALIPDFGILEMLTIAILFAHKSLIEHVGAVAQALGQSVQAGRKSVGMIVGRDTRDLDESDVTRAAIESAAENFSDGVVAPAFWALLFGAPGILFYKLVNTADSMIGHRSEDYEQFGKAAARLDDLLNWIPARATAALFCLVGRAKDAWNDTAEDAVYHRSPNAGWPEAAMAVSLGIALAGPRSYFGERTDDPFVNGAARRVLEPGDIIAAVALLWKSWRVSLGGLVLLAIVWRLVA